MSSTVLAIKLLCLSTKPTTHTHTPHFVFLLYSALWSGTLQTSLLCQLPLLRFTNRGREREERQAERIASLLSKLGHCAGAAGVILASSTDPTQLRYRFPPKQPHYILEIQQAAGQGPTMLHPET